MEFLLALVSIDFQFFISRNDVIFNITKHTWSFGEYWENADQSSGQHNQHIFPPAFQVESQQVGKSSTSDL